MKTLNVVCAVIHDGKKILVTQRGYGEFKGGWEFPGGKVELGESPEEALKREIGEELEAEIEIEKDLGTVEWDYPAFHLRMRAYLVSLTDPHLVLKEAEAAKYVPVEELSKVPFLPADLSLVDAIKKAVDEI